MIALALPKLRGPIIRPWALVAPILVLLVTLPLLRPLRHPSPLQISDNEASRLATVQSLIEHRSLSINDSSFVQTRDKIVVNEHYYSNQPPVFAVLLAGAYWAIHALGWSLDRNPTLVAYLLTVLGVTLPVSLCAGLIYRMGRIFELSRPWRAALAAGVIFGSGLISYGVVLNSHAPAAALVLASAACLIHITLAGRSTHTPNWLLLSGLCAGFAAVIDPPALVFLMLFLFVIVAMRWPIHFRLGGMLLYALGAAPAVLLHTTLVLPILGDLLPPKMHREFAVVDSHVAALNAVPVLSSVTDTPPDEEEVAASLQLANPSRWLKFLHTCDYVTEGLFGDHGVFTHFPIMLFGILGVGAVLHRHWPSTTKTLAVSSVFGGLVIVIVCALCRIDWKDAMFASRWFIPFLPILLFWTGAWIRRRHHPVTWALAAILLAFSTTVSLIGATNPFPQKGFEGYTAAGALNTLIHADAPPVAAQAVVSGG
jgi:hypothetical protein